MEAKQELQDDVKKYTRRKWISRLAIVTGAAMIPDSIYQAFRYRETPEIYHDCNEAENSFYTIYGKGEINSLTISNYKNPEIKEFLEILPEYNSKRKQALEGLARDFGEMGKNPDVIKSKRNAKWRSKRNWGEFLGGIVTLVSGCFAEPDYKNKQKKAKRKLNELVEVEENQK